MAKHTLILKGLELSTDYDLLWKLINDGYRIPAYLVYTDVVFLCGKKGISDCVTASP